MGRMISLAQQKKKNPENTAETDGCRLDVWLFRTRLFKTRSLATKMILGGKIRVTRNGRTERIRKPGLVLKSGELVTFMRGPKLIEIEMVSAGYRRGPAPEAQSLYRDHSSA
jgi:ribosome-associated heat shock protein Hsp15